MPDDYGMDMSAVGNAARGSKADGGGRQELVSFSVKRGDNGGVIVCETYERKAPEGRRSGAAFPMSGDYKENPYSPGDLGKASAYIGSLMAKMGGGAPAPPAPGPPPMPRPGPAVAKVTPDRVTVAGPNAGVSAPRPLY